MSRLPESEQIDVRRTLETYQFHREVSLAPLGRISAIVGRNYDVYDMIDNVGNAEHLCRDTECCEIVIPYSADSHGVLSRLGWVYALSTWDGDVTYVGKTSGRLPLRIHQHAQYADEPHWRIARRAGLHVDLVAGWNVGDSCERLEKAVILALQPIMNTQGVR